MTDDMAALGNRLNALNAQYHVNWLGVLTTMFAPDGSALDDLWQLCAEHMPRPENLEWQGDPTPKGNVV